MSTIPEEEDATALAPFDAAMIAAGRPVRFSLAGGAVWAAGEAASDALLLLAGKAALTADTPFGPFELCQLRAPCALGLTDILLAREKRLAGLELRGRCAFARVGAEEARPWVLLDTVGGASFRRIALSSLAQAIRGTNAGLKRLFDDVPALKDRFAGLRFDELIAEASGSPDGIAPPPAVTVSPLLATPKPPSTPPAASAPVREEAARWSAADGVFALAGLDPQLFPKLGMTVREYAPGSVLARSGEAGSEAFLVLSGRVRVSANIAGQGEEAFAFADAGQLLGEMALIDDAPRSADLIAHDGPVRVAVLRRDVFRKLVVVAPVGSASLIGGLVVSLARRLCEAIQRHVSLFIMAGGFPSSQPQQLPPLDWDEAG